ncbi:MAG TPA: dienelactone hydrolase family protein [Geminicoccaceae bacterium]
MRKLALGAALVALAPGLALAGEEVVYDVDGQPYAGYYAAPESDPKGLVLIIHDWDGLGDYEEQRADMLAEMGYAAFAVDLFGQGNRPETTEARRAETRKLYDDRDAMRARILTGLETARERVDLPAVVMGYCFGGAATLELARSGEAPEVTGYASFHGGLQTPEGQSWEGADTPLLVMHGGADTSVTMDHVATLAAELETAGTPYEIQVYSGAPHGFTEFGSDRYQERADQESWEAFSDFLAEQFGST